MNSGLRVKLASIGHAPGMNAGLWHDVYLPSLRGDGDDEKHGEVLRVHLERLAGMGIPEGYARAFQQREELLRGLRGGVDGGVTRCFNATVTGRMIVGLGAASVTETSVAMLRAWGVPYVPGSALKGLASSAAHRGGGPSWLRAEEAKEGGADAGVLFGSTAWQGVVTFHDAWWVPEGATLPLDLDVMTVHHADYYMAGKDAPADWDEPNPVTFVTARGSYLVALSGPTEWVDVAHEWLALALARDGVGAKTHAGYGRTTVAERLTEVEKGARRVAESIANLPAQHKGAGTARQHVAQLAEALAKGAEQRRVAEVAHALYAREPKFWKAWAKAPERTEAEREAVRALGMVPEEPVVVTPSAPGEKAAEKAPEERAWLPAGAWIAGAGKGATLHARVGEATYTREARDIKLKDDFRAALAAASEATPTSVEVQLKEGGKLVAMRRG